MSTYCEPGTVLATPGRPARVRLSPRCCAVPSHPRSPLASHPTHFPWAPVALFFCNLKIFMLFFSLQEKWREVGCSVALDTWHCNPLSAYLCGGPFTGSVRFTVELFRSLQPLEWCGDLRSSSGSVQAPSGWRLCPRSQVGWARHWGQSSPVVLQKEEVNGDGCLWYMVPLPPYYSVV